MYLTDFFFLLKSTEEVRVILLVSDELSDTTVPKNVTSLTFFLL